MNGIKRHIPNCITVLRIIGTVLLFLTEPLTAPFYAFYTLTGFTDVLDGFLARRWKVESDFGAKLDSVADLLFYIVTLVRLLPVIIRKVPDWVFYLIGVMVAIRLTSYITVAVKFRRFASAHTWMNKLTGAMVFLLPYTLPLSMATGYCIAVVVVGNLAAVEELAIHAREKEYHSNVRTYLSLKKQGEI